MRILTFTSLYPNKIQPRHGIFVQGRMNHFDQIDGTSRRVIAPVQYMPLAALIPGSRFHNYSRIPAQEMQGNIQICYPRYFTIPGTTIINAAKAMAQAAEKALPGNDFDLVDGHYLYPDGVAAHRFAKMRNKPLILTARGSDVNYWMEQKAAKEEIIAALTYASRIICVSQALKDRLMSHGVDENKITVLLNGVDKEFFEVDKKHKGDYFLTVGNLVPLKGHAYILHSLNELPDEKLIIIGSGERAKSLKELAEKLDISRRVTFLDHIPHQDLPSYYNGAKATILMSSSEGMPNVVLESLACGTPVIATNVGGIPEVVTTDNGILLPERTSAALTEALKSSMNRHWNRQKISQNMKYLDWQKTSRRLYDIFAAAL